MRLVAEPYNQVLPHFWRLDKRQKKLLVRGRTCKAHLHTHLEKSNNVLTRDDGSGIRKACGDF